MVQVEQKAEFPEGQAVSCVAGGLGGPWCCLPGGSFGSLTALVLSRVLWSIKAELRNGDPEDTEDQPRSHGNLI